MWNSLSIKRNDTPKDIAYLVETPDSSNTLLDI